jgi:broad specificity phosphatase PhoE
MVENTLPRVYLIRHARPSAAWGEGAADPGLDELGATQAQAAARWLAASPPAERPRRVISSPLRRCLETAKPFADALGVAVEIDPLMGEIPTPVKLAPAERPGWLARAMAGRWCEIEGDLDYEEWRHRVSAAVGRYSQAAVFSHFVAINAVMSVVTRTDRVVCFRPDHASVTTLAVEADEVRLVSMGAEAASDVL